MIDAQVAYAPRSAPMIKTRQPPPGGAAAGKQNQLA